MAFDRLVELAALRTQVAQAVERHRDSAPVLRLLWVLFGDCLFEKRAIDRQRLLVGLAGFVEFARRLLRVTEHPHGRRQLGPALGIAFLVSELLLQRYS